MKALIVALYPYRAKDQDAWLDHGAAMTYAASKHTGNVDFLDMKTLFNRRQLRERLMGYDLVAFGMKSSYYSIGMDVIAVAKEVGAKVMVAGVHTAAAPKDLLDNPNIDYIFYGESEVTFPQFLLNPECFGREIAGEIPCDLDALPWVDREIFESPIESALGWLGHERMTTVIAARGCPFNCGFCQPLEKIHFGSKLRRRSVSSLVGEIRYHQVKFNPDFLMIHDDTFLLQPKWLEEFIEDYPSVGIPFWGSARADGIIRHEKLFRQLVKKANWELVSIGFESGNQRLLDMMHKETTVEQNLEAARIVKSTGAKLYGNFMLGLPGETRQETMNTMKMHDTMKADLNSFAFFSPYPGNSLGEQAIKDGISLLGPYQYNRFPFEPKIKGVDYTYLNQALTGFRE